jgi:hypothetical protein
MNRRPVNGEAALPGRLDTVTTTRASDDTAGRGAQKLSAEELLATPHALLSRGHLRELGLERRAIDAVFKSCSVVCWPGYSRPLIRVADYLALLEQSTYTGDRVRP